MDWSAMRGEALRLREERARQERRPTSCYVRGVYVTPERREVRVQSCGDVPIGQEKTKKKKDPKAADSLFMQL